MGLKEFYYSLEDKYYAFMDGLEQKGLKVYEYFVDPLEQRGIPSFPVFCLLVLVALGALAWGAITLMSGVGGEPTATLTVKVTAAGKPLDDVSVKLLFGDQTLRAKTTNGLATLKNVPRGKKLELKVDQKGYAPFSTPTLISKDKAKDFVEIQLEPLEKKELFFQVTDSEGNTLSGVTVLAKDSFGKELPLETNALGRVSVSYQSKADVFNLRLKKEGYEEQAETCAATKPICEFVLYSKTKPPEPTPSAKASVRVELVDSKGDPVAEAKITLRNAVSSDTVDQVRTDALGKAFFENVVDVGTEVYVTVEAAGFEPHNTDSKQANEITEFLVQLKGKTPGEPPERYKIIIEFVDADKNPVENAQVSVFLARQPLKELTSSTTSSEGKVEFEASPTAEVYATVYAQGYLPTRTRFLKGGESTRVTLTKTLVGNYGSLKVNVVNEEGTAVELASVTLLSKDGFFLGVPRQDTTADGYTSFSGLPLETVQAMATYQAQKGTSDLVEVTTEEKEITVRLRPAEAFVSAIAKETGTNRLLDATFTAHKFSDGSRVDSCQTKGSSCALKVPAKTKIFLKVNATGFVPFASEEFEVDAGQTLKKEVFLIDASLSQQLKILDARVVDSSGRNVTFVDKGKTYQFLVSANLPSDVEKAGVYLRVGTKSDTPDEPVVFVDYSKPPSADIVKGTRYNPGASCAGDVGEPSNEIKWVDFSFNQFGSRTVSAKVFVRPKATSQDVLVLNYRIYAKKADAFVRSPEDPTFGTRERTEDLDSCYAKTFELRLPVKEGGSTCSDNSCITTLFKVANATAANGPRVPLNTEFQLKLELRAFAPLDAPFLKVESDKSIELKQYDFSGSPTQASFPVTIPLSFAGETNGTLLLKAALPTQNAKLAFTFGDSTGTLLEAQRYVVVQGTGVFSLALAPLEIKANQDNIITVNVKSEQGKAVEDAKITLKEKRGSPFDGFPSGQEALLGDGSDGKGKEGVYRLQNLRPTSVGDVSVVVQRNSFTDAEKLVSVTVDQPLDISPDPSLIELSCEERNVIAVSTKLNTELKVTGSFSGTPCADVRVLGTGASPTTKPSSLSPSPSPSPSPLPTTGGKTISFRVKPGKETKLYATPTRSGSGETQCVMIFNSETPSGIAAGSQDAWFSAACAQASPSPSPNATISPSPSPSPTTPIAGFCPRPNFSDLIGKHLATYGLNNEPESITALSAPTVLVADQRGISVLREGDGCTRSDSSLTCKKPIYSIIPMNAKAFSIVNRLFTTTDVLAEPSSLECFSIQEVGSSSSLFGSILGGTMKNTVQSLAGLARDQYRTYVIAFLPKKGCINYDGSTLSLTDKSDKGLTLKLAVKSLGGGTTAELNFQVEPQQHASDKYAFLFAPSSGEIALRGTKNAKFQEPALFANNIHADKDFHVGVTGPFVAPTSGNDVSLIVNPGQVVPGTLALDKDKVDINAKFGENKAVPLTGSAVKRIDAPTGLDAFDIVGNVDAETSECSGASYCVPDNAKKYVEDIKTALNDLYSTYAKSLDTLGYGDLLSNPEAMRYVADNAARDYAGLCQAYKLCLQQVCSRYSTTTATTTTSSPAASPASASTAGIPPECAGLATGSVSSIPYTGATYPYGTTTYPYGTSTYPYGTTSSTYGTSAYPYDLYGSAYAYPTTGAGYDPCVSATYTDPYAQAYLRDPYSRDRLYREPYYADLLARDPSLRTGLLNPAYSAARLTKGTDPILKVTPVVHVPVKVAGSGGGIKIYALAADLSVLGRTDWMKIDHISSNPYGFYTPLYQRSGRPSEPSPPKDKETQVSGFPYLKKEETEYKLVGWIKGAAKAS